MASAHPDAPLALTIKKKIEERRWDEDRQLQQDELDRERGQRVGRILKGALPDATLIEVNQALWALAIDDGIKESDAFKEGVVEVLS